MEVVQDTYCIPDDIATGLATGLYQRIGSVVRYAKGSNRGQIVKHLDPIDLPIARRSQKVAPKILKFAQQHKKEAVIVGAVTGIVGVGIIAYKKRKKREPQVVVEFRKALGTYIGAVRSGTMDIDIINNLMDALDVLRQNKDYAEISIQLTAEELDVLVGRIYEYTIKLAKDNNINLEEHGINISNTNTDTIINLQNYLKAQKRIFEVCA